MPPWTPGDPTPDARTPGAGPDRRDRRGTRGEADWRALFTGPRNLVWVVLGAVVLIGVGRRLLQSWRARGAVARLRENTVSLDDIGAAADHGRAGLEELFQLLTAGATESQRQAAGRALSTLWARDELIAEEEKGLVLRGFDLHVHARKRYPRGLKAEVPVTLEYGLPFLDSDGSGIRPACLEWSHRVLGARRAGLEQDSPWTPGPVRATFTIVPDDFDDDGPHALVAQVRVRTAGLTDSWELALPHARFGFEFDPVLRVEALLALPDERRAAEFSGRVRLAAAQSGAVPSFLPLSDTLALRGPPMLEVDLPLPADLAHEVALEFEGFPGRYSAGVLIVSGQGGRRAGPGPTFRQGLDAPPLAVPFERPGRQRMRAVLSADPHRAWADPDVRSLWPGPIETGWVEVEVVRR